MRADIKTDGGLSVFTVNQLRGSSSITQGYDEWSYKREVHTPNL